MSTFSLEKLMERIGEHQPAREEALKLIQEINEYRDAHPGTTWQVFFLEPYTIQLRHTNAP